MDTVDKATRSRIMAKVGQRDTGPEMRLRLALHRMGFRYRLHYRELPGSPDLVFPMYRAVIFVHGCFWHDHGCRFSTKPTTRKEFWDEKLEANRARDARKASELKALGWRILVVWECTLKGRQPDIERTTKRVARWLKSKRKLGEIDSVNRLS